MADGGMLPPYGVFKRNTHPKEKLLGGIIVRALPKGWMDEELLDDWLWCVWGRRVGGLGRHKASLY